MDIDDLVLRIHLVDINGEKLPVNALEVPLVEFMNKPFLWSFEPEETSGVCLKLRGRNQKDDDSRS